MTQMKALVLRAAGINCDMESVFAVEQAGGTADRVHINALIENKQMLDDYQLILFPGGFSYGDDVAAGKILANQVMHHLSDMLRKFIDDGKLVLGICNGFQVLVKTGLLPGFEGETVSDKVTIAFNDCGKFEDRWVYLEPVSEKCVFTTKGRRIYLPIAHGEGKVVTDNDQTLKRLVDGGHVVFKYVDADGNEGPFPINPNGAVASIAGLTDSTGRVMGLMPHPERFVRTTQHPRWTRNREGVEADGTTIFDNAAKYIADNF